MTAQQIHWFWRWAAPALAAAALAACSIKTDCRVRGVYGVQVAIEDTTTLEPAAANSFGTVRDAGGFVDTFQLIELDIRGIPWRVGAALDRPGIYEVFIQNQGYYNWSAQNVEVAANQCGVVPNRLRALMCPMGTIVCDSSRASP